MRAIRVLLITLCLLIPMIAGAQTWPNFEGNFYAGQMQADLVLVEMETVVSIPDVVGSAHWQSTISSDGATMLFCRETLYLGDEPISGGGCVTLLWSPSAHAYVAEGMPNGGMIPVTIVVVTPFVVQLIEGQTVEGSDYYVLCVPPLWVWEHTLVARMLINGEMLK